MVALLVGIATAQSSQEQQVRKAIDEHYKAIVDKNEEALNRLYADDYVRIGTGGEISDKTQAVKALVGSDWTVTRTNQSDLTFHLYGDVVVVTGISTYSGMNKGENEQTAKDRFTQIWVKRNGAWQMTLQQRTNLEHASK